jgi:hypothetical protein
MAYAPFRRDLSWESLDAQRFFERAAPLREPMAAVQEALANEKASTQAGLRRTSSVRGDQSQTHPP